MTIEAEIERYLVKRSRAAGGEIRKVSWIGRRGAPDRLVMLPFSRRNGRMVTEPRAVFVELKRPGKRPTPQQAREHARMKRYGLEVLKIDTFEQVDELFA